MSDRELTRFEVLRDLDQRRLTIAAAAELMGLERRQICRLLKVYRAEGAAGLISKRRGRASNRRTPAALRAEALGIIRERYWDFGPTLAAEKLSEVHGTRPTVTFLSGRTCDISNWWTHLRVRKDDLPLPPPDKVRRGAN